MYFSSLTIEDTISCIIVQVSHFYLDHFSCNYQHFLHRFFCVSLYPVFLLSAGEEPPFAGGSVHERSGELFIEVSAYSILHTL